MTARRCTDMSSPGSVIAGMVVAGPSELSGEYLNWSEDRLASFQLGKGE
jgi:hypothetical protein